MSEFSESSQIHCKHEKCVSFCLAFLLISEAHSLLSKIAQKENGDVYQKLPDNGLMGVIIDKLMRIVKNPLNGYLMDSSYCSSLAEV